MERVCHRALRTDHHVQAFLPKDLLYTTLRVARRMRGTGRHSARLVEAGKGGVLFSRDPGPLDRELIKGVGAYVTGGSIDQRTL